ALGGAELTDRLDLPTDPDDPAWAHLLVEASKLAGHDRPDVLHETADGEALLARIRRRRELLDTERASVLPLPHHDGDTTYLCTVDGAGMGVSLIQSNASGFGSWLAEPRTGVGLHNRGIGFS